MSACKGPKWAINLLSGWCFLSLHDPLKPWPASGTSLHSSVLKSWLLNVERSNIFCVLETIIDLLGSSLVFLGFLGDLASSLRG